MTGRALLAIVLLATMASHAWALDGLQPGMKAPQLPLETLDGKPTSLAPPAGARALLIVFWATWSAKSPEVLERAHKVRTALGSKGLAVLGVNVESQQVGAAERAAVAAMAGRLGLGFPVAVDRGLEAFHAYGVVAVPSSILVTADTTVIASLESYPIAGREEFFDLVEATVLGRPLPSPAAAQGPEPNPRASRFYHLGRSLAARGMTDQAETNLKRSIELDPAFVLPRVLMGQLYRERATAREGIQVGGEIKETLRRSDEERARWLREAETYLTEAVRLAPQSAPALTELARLHLDRGEAPQTRALVERALTADPVYPPALALLGALLLESGEAPRARAKFAEAIEHNPLDWRLSIVAAQAFERRGLGREALEAYRRGVELLWRQRTEVQNDAR